MAMQSCLEAVRAIIPPLTHTSHKGSAGRIGILGGCFEYTGAPYFSAISAMKSGADLVHIFCGAREVANVIQTYSPDLIVHPVREKESMVDWLPRLHALVVGPGLGRDSADLANVKKIIIEAKQKQKHIVIDADGLYLITNEPEVIAGYPQAILTPNVVEFSRLYKKMFGKELQASSNEGNSREETKSLAAKMGGVTILRKGHADIISDGLKVIQCDEEGCMRRCGGQGDVLAGILGLFSFWAAEKGELLNSKFGLPPTMVAAYGSCFVTKKCAEAAFAKHHRSMLSHDLVNEIPLTFSKYLEQ